MYYHSDQSENTVNITNFNGTYTLDNLRPFTEYSIYVTAVRLIGGRLQEGMKSRTLTERTLAGGTYFYHNIIITLIHYRASNKEPYIRP